MKKIKNKSGVKQNSKKAAQKRISSSVLIVKNAAGDPDTKAKIEVQNRINYIPKVSVIIPVYNVQNYLRPCLDSVLKQTLKEIEIICVDDGSTDGSLEILKQYAAKDHRITVLKQKNLHAGVARNAGMAVARGEYLSFLDSDDFFELTMLADAYKKVTEDASDIVIFGSYTYDQIQRADIRKNLYADKFVQHSPFAPQQFAQDLFLISNPNAWTKLFRRELVRKNKVFFESLSSCNDITFVNTMLTLAHRISLINTPYVHYRINTKTNISANRGEKSVCFIYAIKKLQDNLKKYNTYALYRDTLEKRAQSSFNWELTHCTPEQKAILQKEALAVLGKDYTQAPKVSVIIPVYNTAAFLPECLDSVLKQTLKDIEIICVNDGSTDNSLEILKTYAAKDSRIHIINQENQGLSCSRNNALKQAKGEYILFLDSDDYLDLETCAELYKKSSKFNLEMVNFEGINFDEQNHKTQLNSQQIFYIAKDQEKTVYEGSDLAQLKGQIPISACRFFYNRKFLAENQLLFPEHLCFEDNYFVLKALLCVKRYGVLRKICYYRRLHSNSITQNWNKHFSDYIQIVLKIHDLFSKNHLQDAFAEKRMKGYVSNAIRKYNSFTPADKQKYRRDMLAFIHKFGLQDDTVIGKDLYKEELKNWYQKVTGKYLNLDNPRTFNEKIQWMKLYDSTPIKTRLADKYLVREWVKEKIGGKYLIPLLGVYNTFEEIDFDKLPNQFVIKCNHGCGYNIIVKDKSKLDLLNTKAKLDKWMNENFAFKYGYELHYRDIIPKIIIERFIENKGLDDLYDYKFWCFNGKVKYIQFLSERNLSGLKMAFYDRNWHKQTFVYSHPLDIKEIKKPDNLEQMIQLAETLSEEFPHVRVDFYRLNDGTIYFGEMTFTSASGVCKWNEEKIDIDFGNMIKLPELAYNLDTGEYYKLPKENKIKAYLLFPYNLCRKMYLRRQEKKLAERNIKRQLLGARIDIKNYGDKNNALQIKAAGRVYSPSWAQNDQGQGQVVEFSDKHQRITLKAVQKGRLSFSFKGQDKRFEKARIPLWIDYKSIKIDGREILSAPIGTWHDKPFRYEMPVQDGQVVSVEIVQQYHQYAKEDVQDLIRKLNPNSHYIQEHLDKIVEDIYPQITVYKVSKISQLPMIEAEHFFTIGKACRPAFWLKKYNLRQHAYPFDWMKDFQLNSVLKAFRDGCSNWFSDYSEGKSTLSTRYVIDNTNHVTSVHAFPGSCSVADYLPEFQKTMQRRMQRLQQVCKNSRKVCILCNREENVLAFADFAKQLSRMYPQLKLTIVNVVHTTGTAGIDKYDISKKIEIFFIRAEDVKKLKPGEPALFLWEGNEQLYEKICKRFKIVKQAPETEKNKFKSFFRKFSFTHKIQPVMDLMNQNQQALLQAIHAAAAKNTVLEERCAALSKQLNIVNREVQQAKLWIKQTYEAFPTINKQLANAQNVLLSQLVTEKKVNRLAAITSLELKKQRKHNQEMKNLLSGFVSATQNDLQSLKQREVVKPAQLQQAVQQLAQQLLQTSQKRNEQLLQLQELLLSAHHAALQAVKDLDIVKPAQLQQAVQQLAQQLLQTAQKRNEQLIQLQELLVSNHTTALQCLRGLDIIKPEHIQKTADQLAKQMQEIFHKQDEQLADMQKLLASGENTLQHLKGIDVAEAQQLKQTEEELTQRIAEAAGAQSELLSSVSAALRKQQEEGLQKTGNLYLSLETLNKTGQKTQAELQKQLRTLQDKSLRQYHELNFADLLHDSTQHSPWLKDKNFSLYGWAANYSFIYTLFRILDKVSPQHILEMGLGQTTRLTSQYVAYKNPAATLDVCEHNQSWIDIYTPELPHSEHIHVHHLELEYFDFEGKPNDKYKDIAKVTGNTKYNLIIVDGPVGGGKNFPRSNIVDLIPHNLAEDFIIIFDDAERAGEQKTIEQTQARLTEQKITFATQQRHGAKTQFLIFSKSLEFVQYL